MSRRHRGRPHHHAPAGGDGQRRSANTEPARPHAPEANAPRAAAAAPPRIDHQVPSRNPEPRAEPPIVPSTARQVAAGVPHEPADTVGAANGGPTPSVGTTHPVAGPVAQQQHGDRLGQCTAPQLRRFIKSRPYVPMHELRRRFSINGDDDDVTPVRLNPGWIYVGLPNHEGHLLGELLRTGEIGYELSLDPRTPIVIGVYPMRPIPRP
jgi:hypothetical protein